MYDAIPQQQTQDCIYYFVPIEKNERLIGYQVIHEGLVASADSLSSAEESILYWCNETLKLRPLHPSRTIDDFQLYAPPVDSGETYTTEEE